MDDPELQEIRKQRLAQLQSQFKVRRCFCVAIGYFLKIDIAGQRCRF